METFLRDLRKNKYAKIICMALCFFAILLIMVWARAFYGSMNAYNEGETYLSHQQYIRAITFFDRSIHWYTPLNPYVRKSAERLWEIGNHAELEGDTKLALIAYRTIRSGFYAATSFCTPGKRWIEKCDLKIYKLIQLELAEKKVRDGRIWDKKVLPERQMVTIPNIFWTIILEIGFLGWIGSVIGFIVFRLGRKGDSTNLISSKLPWAAFTIVFFALWIVGMMKA